MKKYEDKTYEIVTFLEKNTTKDERSMFVELIKSIVNYLEKGILVTASSKIPFEKLISSKISSKDIEVFVSIVSKLEKTQPKDLLQVPYLAPRIEEDFQNNSKVLNLRGYNVSKLLKVILSMKTEYSGEKIRIVLDDIGLHKDADKSEYYKIRGKRLSMLRLIQSGLSSSITRGKKLVHKEITQINNNFCKELNLREALILRARTEYRINTRVYKLKIEK